MTHAYEHHPATALIVVHGITLDGDAATGGAVTMHHRWLPAGDSLTPIAYRHEVADA